VGLAGLGGGGSHIVQQLAHIGFQRFVVYEGDVVEESNLNRLVGATSIDVPRGNTQAISCEEDDFRPPGAHTRAGVRWQVAGQC
jgi:molybdopterin/thiamine biosynthesis adenylyltransferase